MLRLLRWDQEVCVYDNLGRRDIQLQVDQALLKAHTQVSILTCGHVDCLLVVQRLADHDGLGVARLTNLDLRAFRELAVVTHEARERSSIVIQLVQKRLIFEVRRLFQAFGQECDVARSNRDDRHPDEVAVIALQQTDQP
ncbi:hypothetical protein D3C87_992880 [compost metagenome]